MITPPTKIHTNRLLLRMPQPDDAKAIFAKYAQDPEVTKYLIWSPHKNIEVTKEFVNQCIDSWKTGLSFPWVIIQKMEKELIGMFELRIDQSKADFGYVLAKRYWGKGYATEITQSIVDWLKSQDSIQLIWATCDIENGASARVMEKAGLHKTGVLPAYIVHPNISAELRDCYRYVIEKGIDY